MSFIKQHAPAALFLAGLSLPTTASASLIVRPGGMVYDSDLNITWLADANYAQTSGYDADGLMDWTAATTWASNLVYGGYDDWRLPTTMQPDATCGTQSGGDSYGYNCTGSELGHLFYSEIGATAGNWIHTGNATELAKFTHVQTYIYWSGMEYAPNPGNAWYFDTGVGYQALAFKSDALYAWAVRSGDVAAASVPEPGSLMLLGAGLVGWLGGSKRRRG